MADAHTLKHSAYWFIGVGASAALVHYLVAVSIDHLALMSPAMANILGFSFAFPVSYLGHRALTFAQQNTDHKQALPRFLIVAAMGFCANQALLLLCLTYTTLPFWLVLALVMVVIAFTTYVLSRYWAFQSK